jgi:hypothetical protein
MSRITIASGIDSSVPCGPGLGLLTQWLVFLVIGQLLGAAILLMCFFI